jgi:glycosyltransferase involved in cell wall biosynthesis
MKPWHGVEQLLDAFARIHRQYPQAALVLVGEGPENEQVNERLKRADLRGDVVWTGHVPHAEVAPLVASFDIAVAPYLPVEGFYFDPLKVVEYLAAGKAVVYSDQGDLRPLVGSGGLAYAPGSVDQLTDRLEQAVANPSLRRKLGASATAHGLRLDWRTVAERVLRFASGAPDTRPVDALSTPSEDGESPTEQA